MQPSHDVSDDYYVSFTPNCKRRNSKTESMFQPLAMFVRPRRETEQCCAVAYIIFSLIVHVTE